ncbi:MAG TPA: hypothetical protein VGF82_12555 [Terracidiphilus sp.]|jgi:uncharacterized membrane protein
MIQNLELDAYMTSLRSHLGPMTLDDREEILREIGAHIRDSVEQDGAFLQAVLQKLGPPAELAAQYRDGLLIRKASRSISPLLLLRASLRLATKGLSGVVVFFAAMFGYLIGGGMVLSAFAKGIFPAHTGVWMSGGQLISSGTLFEIPPAPAHDIAGWWYLPAALTLGSLLLLLTTFIIQTSLRISQKVQGRLIGNGNSASEAYGSLASHRS